MIWLLPKHAAGPNPKHKPGCPRYVWRMGEPCACPTCPYINSLDRECGRDSTHGEYCGFHAVLAAFEADCLPPADQPSVVQAVLEAYGARA